MQRNVCQPIIFNIKFDIRQLFDISGFYYEEVGVVFISAFHFIVFQRRAKEQYRNILKVFIFSGLLHPRLPYRINQAGPNPE